MAARPLQLTAPGRHEAQLAHSLTDSWHAPQVRDHLLRQSAVSLAQCHRHRLGTTSSHQPRGTTGPQFNGSRYRRIAWALTAAASGASAVGEILGILNKPRLVVWATQGDLSNRPGLGQPSRCSACPSRQAAVPQQGSCLEDMIIRSNHCAKR